MQRTTTTRLTRLTLLLLVQRVYGIVAAAVIAADACEMSAVCEDGHCERDLKRSSDVDRSPERLRYPRVICPCYRLFEDLKRVRRRLPAK